MIHQSEPSNDRVIRPKVNSDSRSSPRPLQFQRLLRDRITGIGYELSQPDIASLHPAYNQVTSLTVSSLQGHIPHYT